METMINLQFFNPRIKFVSFIIINNQLIYQRIYHVSSMNEWYFLTREHFKVSWPIKVFSLKKGKCQKESIWTQKQANSPLLPIIYCRFYKTGQRVLCEPLGTITDKSAAELLQSWTASNPRLKTASNFKILFRSFCHNRILFRISGGLMMPVLTDISWSSR